MQKAIEVRHLCKSFDQLEVLRDVSLSVDEGEVVSVIGPSGSGKSTLARCICRLEPIIEVIEENGDRITYVKMDAAKAKRVVAEHLINGRICQDLTIGAAEAAAKTADKA